MTVRRTTLSFSLIAALAALGCGSKGESKPDQKSLDRISQLEDQVKSQNDLINQLRDDKAKAEMGMPSGGEYVFVIEGDMLTLKARPATGGGGAAIDDQTANELSTKFTGMVQASRGPIQKCYEQALKKSQTLQSRTINLSLLASFAASGEFRSVSFSPDLPEGFDSCLRGVASKWKMPSAPAGTSYKANVKLTPT